MEIQPRQCHGGGWVYEVLTRPDERVSFRQLEERRKSFHKPGRSIMIGDACEGYSTCWDCPYHQEYEHLVACGKN
jgi:hypothetical protein